MIKIDRQLCEETIEKARNSSRKRMNFNFHKDEEAIIQRMLNAIEPGTYIRPHKHDNPDKNEVFLLISGKALILEFSDDGNITGSYVLDVDSGNYGAEIGPGIYHTILSLSAGTIAYEIKEGPYLPATVKHFAPWAPEEGSDEVEAYLEKLINLSGAV
jgi:cupin fold WbuC family metalloprotein